MNATFRLTRNQIALRALRLTRRAIKGEPPDSDDMNQSLETLNLVLRSLQDMDIHLHVTETREYRIPSAYYVEHSGVSYRCIERHEASTDTEPGGSNVLWKTKWYEEELPSGFVASSWLDGTTYAAANHLVLEDDVADIEHAQWITENREVTELTLQDNHQFDELHHLTDKSEPKILHFQRALEPAQVRLSPHPQAEGILKLRIARYLLNFDTTQSETADTPRSWQDALTYMVAADLADEFGLSLEERNWFTQKAAAKFSLVKRGFRERSTYERVQPTYDQR